MAGLSKMLDKAKQLQRFNGFYVGANSKNSICLPLLYDDDTLIFLEVERSRVKYLYLTLQRFEALRIAYELVKKFYYPVNKVPTLEELAEILCCGTASMPTTWGKI